MTSAEISQAFLRDFDWKLNLVMASDSLSSMREPVLVLTLTIQDQNGHPKDVLVELPPNDLDNFLASLNAANEVVKQLKV